MKTERTYLLHADRKLFDLGLCTPEAGWTALKTHLDAPEYGHWTRASTRQIIGYVFGDVITTTCETDEEFASEVSRIREKAYVGDGEPDPRA